MVQKKTKRKREMVHFLRGCNGCLLVMHEYFMFPVLMGTVWIGNGNHGLTFLENYYSTWPSYNSKLAVDNMLYCCAIVVVIG